MRTMTGWEYVLLCAPVDLAYRCRLTGDGKLMLSSRRADMRWAAVPSSRGIGRPSAGTRDVEEEFAGWENRGGNAKGKECLRDLD